ncbi:phytosulfokine [Artemisia annua]|uniref:Phytosulfokine n=1 Tax=Artemisia annua TaxID=35608 RepID=A0A2U1NTC7_ARTAN|nr:phytosulfokine [Artemisia annua]
MSRTTIFLLILALILCSTQSQSTRLMVAATANTKLQNKVYIFGGDETAEIEQGCEGIGEDECLMRRTLAAHIDYIYTQKKNP